MDKRFAETIRGRLAHLREAEEAYAKAKEHRGRKRHKQAAKQYERAADLYRSIGLGLLAKTAFAAAAESYEHVEDMDGRKRCGLRAKSLPVYWDESYHDAKWG
jgi:hypothetical protein